MRKTASFVVLLTAVLLAGCGGGDTAQSIGKEMIANMAKMADILEGVTDEASANAAVPKIDAVRASMRDIAKRAKSGKTDAAGEKAMNELMAKEMPPLVQRLMTAKEKLTAKPEVMKILEKAMVGMENDL